MRKVSASKVRKFLQCNRAWQDSYLQGNWGELSQPARQGIIAHEAIARAYEFKKKHRKEMDIEEILNHVNVAYEEEFKNGNK